MSLFWGYGAVNDMVVSFAVCMGVCVCGRYGDLALRISIRTTSVGNHDTYYIDRYRGLMDGLGMGN